MGICMRHSGVFAIGHQVVRMDCGSALVRRGDPVFFDRHVNYQNESHISILLISSGFLHGLISAVNLAVFTSTQAESQSKRSSFRHFVYYPILQQCHV